MFCINKLYFCRNFFLIDWRHKRLKNTIDLIVILWRTLRWIFGKWLVKTSKKKHSFHNKHIYIYGSQTFEFLWIFILYILERFVLSLTVLRKLNTGFIFYWSKIYQMNTQLQNFFRQIQCKNPNPVQKRIIVEQWLKNDFVLYNDKKAEFVRISLTLKFMFTQIT